MNSSQLLEKLVLIGTLRTFPKNALIIQEGDISDNLFVLLKGRVKAFSIGIDAKEITFAEYLPIELFGEMALDGGPRSASVQAMEICQCTIITKEQLQKFLETEPQFAFELIRKVISRARQATYSARNLALLDVYGRLKVFLEQEAAIDNGGKRELIGRLTHQDIATRIGASREMVSKLLKDLENGGYLSFPSQSKIVVGRIPERW
jgi:CRP/FNR family transcriptional regulator, cyclic AMP receptor protein